MTSPAAVLATVLSAASWSAGQRAGLPPVLSGLGARPLAAIEVPIAGGAGRELPAIPEALIPALPVQPLPGLEAARPAPEECCAAAAEKAPFEALFMAASDAEKGSAPGPAPESGAAQGGRTFDQAGSPRPTDDAAGPAAAVLPSAGPGAAMVPAPGSAAPLSAERFEELVSALAAYKPLIPIQWDDRRPTAAQTASQERNERDLQTLVDAAVRRRDVDLLAQMALLTAASTDPQTRNLFYMGLYSLELANLLSYGKPGDYQVGLDAKKARLTVLEHAWSPLRPVKTEAGEVPGRDWLLARIRERYARDYLGSPL